MGIYIKNMEMPKSCWDCCLCVGGWCRAVPYSKRAEVKREKDCPLIEVPTPHGRLIDADAAYNQFLNLMDMQGAINPCQLGTILNDAPTVIKEEGDGE